MLWKDIQKRPKNSAFSLILVGVRNVIRKNTETRDVKPFGLIASKAFCRIKMIYCMEV